MKVLVACEESQTVCKAFRAKGHEAYSCDIQECSGGHPEWHIQGDVIEQLNKEWDLMIAHPPCTFLTVSGNKWMKPEFKTRFPTRDEDRKQAIKFFLDIAHSDIPKICIENPVGIMSKLYKKPSQIIQPYFFGEPFQKTTCLWLKGLARLVSTKNYGVDWRSTVDKGKIRTFKSGKRQAEWYSSLISLPKEERARLRSKTFSGIAAAMADQWG